MLAPVRYKGWPKAFQDRPTGSDWLFIFAPPPPGHSLSLHSTELWSCLLRSPRLLSLGTFALPAFSWMSQLPWGIQLAFSCFRTLTHCPHLENLNTYRPKELALPLSPLFLTFLLFLHTSHEICLFAGQSSPRSKSRCCAFLSLCLQCDVP